MGVVLLVRRGLLPRRLALAGLAMFVLAVVLMVFVFAT
jgi:hypothetical protein